MSITPQLKQNPKVSISLVVTEEDKFLPLNCNCIWRVLANLPL